MTSHERADLEQELAMLDLFNLAAAELITVSVARGDTAMAFAVAAAARGLKADPDAPEPPIQDDRPWARLRRCVGDVEHLTWARWMFAALVSCDRDTIGKVQGLIERRCAN
jgi:hypothetical protein